MSDINNPKLTLFAFHLRNNLAQGSDEPLEKSNDLWKQCQKLGQTLDIPRLENLIERLQGNKAQIGVSPGSENSNSDYLELLGSERSLDFSAIPGGSSLQLRGEVYPLQIHDTYAVDITLRYPLVNLEITQLRCLNSQDCLLPSQIQASLGQTLVLFLQPVEKIENPQIFAENCINNLLPELEAKTLLNSTPSHGQLLGSPIFEYDNGETNPTQHLHILVWLNSHLQTESLEEKGSYYQPLINLLCCRSKILYTYNESRWCNSQARIAYKKLETWVKSYQQLPLNPTERLILLKQLLIEIPQTTFNYASHLRDLELHRTTLETNAKNYQYWLGKLRETSINDQDNLDFLEEFCKRTHTNFIEQIRVDLAYLTPGERLFDQMISTARGIVEIEQAESDRSLERTIQILGTGLGAGGIVASAISGHMDKLPTFRIPGAKEPLSPGLASLSYSLLAVVIIGVIVALINGAITIPKIAQNKNQPKLQDKIDGD